MKRKMTQVDRLNIYMRASMLQVIRLLGWTEEEYYEHQFEQGIAFLEAYLNNDSAIPNILEEKEYWSWWRLEWLGRERDILHALRHDDILYLPRVLRKRFGIVATGGREVMCVIAAKGQLTSVHALEHVYRGEHDGAKLANGSGRNTEVIDESYARLFSNKRFA